MSKRGAKLIAFALVMTAAAVNLPERVMLLGVSAQKPSNARDNFIYQFTKPGNYPFHYKVQSGRGVQNMAVIDVKKK